MADLSARGPTAYEVRPQGNVCAASGTLIFRLPPLAHRLAQQRQGEFRIGKKSFSVIRRVPGPHSPKECLNNCGNAPLFEGQRPGRRLHSELQCAKGRSEVRSSA